MMTQQQHDALTALADILDTPTGLAKLKMKSDGVARQIRRIVAMPPDAGLEARADAWQAVCLLVNRVAPGAIAAEAATGKRTGTDNVLRVIERALRANR